MALRGLDDNEVFPESFTETRRTHGARLWRPPRTGKEWRCGGRVVPAHVGVSETTTSEEVGGCSGTVLEMREGVRVALQHKKEDEGRPAR
jgi:hypothetical protein